MGEWSGLKIGVVSLLMFAVVWLIVFTLLGGWHG